jgi:dethiobiotin synthetase
MKGVFITGTSTDVGKTIASAIIMARACQLFANVTYYKPIQTGCLTDDDSLTVHQLTKAQPNQIATRGLCFKRPLSPHLAAFYENRHIDINDVVVNIKNTCTANFNIVEGAGGLLVPINNRHLMIDLIQTLQWPCILVAKAQLGVINHTLLSLEALRARRIPVGAIILMGERHKDSLDSIRFFSRITQIFSLPWLCDLSLDSVQRTAEEFSEFIDDIF